MPSYNAPIRDMMFVYNELFDSQALHDLPGFEEINDELTETILNEGGKFCSQKILPSNAIGDHQGCTFDQGQVTTPPGFKALYQEYCQAGWSSLVADSEHGGQGLPKTIGLLFEEMVCSTNLAFGMYSGLTSGAYNAITAHANDTLKQRYLPKLVSGDWAGTMCLTEAHCGSDLRLIKTKAQPQTDGSYLLSGSKIFISSGDHDLTDNIIHLVLARTPDAPEGIRGISLFLVPKQRVNDAGDITADNGVSCGSIEEKMGIHGSATCVMHFDNAQGFLVGELHKGMAAMFVMMNTARLGVAIQGLGVGEMAYQNAVAYARERRQGRSVKTNASAEAIPLIGHADIKRMLLTMRAYNEGNRALAVWIARQLDISHRHPDPQVRQQADDFVSFMTPVAKAFMTDVGFDVCNIGLQVFGGHGYIREWGMEQLVRDARIAPIYEGTNGIQALDLIGRKMPLRQGGLMRYFFHQISEFIEKEADQNNADIAAMTQLLTKSLGRLQAATLYIGEQGLRNPEAGTSAACEYLRLVGVVALGYLWLRMAQVAASKHTDSNGAEKTFYAAKIATAKFYFSRILPQVNALFTAIISGSHNITDFDENYF